MGSHFGVTGMEYESLVLPCNGAELIVLANTILAEHAPNSGVEDVKDVGDAAVVYTLAKYGFRGKKLNWKPYRDGWHYAPPGAPGKSSSYHGQLEPAPALFLAHVDHENVATVHWNPILTMKELRQVLQYHKILPLQRCAETDGGGKARRRPATERTLSKRLRNLDASLVDKGSQGRGIAGSIRLREAFRVLNLP